MAEDDPNAVLSDVDGDEDPVPIVLPTAASPDANRVNELLAELDRERQARKAAEDARSDLQNSFNRLKVLAREAISKRDEAVRDKDEALRSADRASADLSDAVKQRDEAVRKAESSKAEIETAAQMLVTGIEKICGKIRNVRNFAAGGMPRSEKYTGLPAVAYGVVKRTNQIVEELLGQVEAAGNARDQAREQVEQRNYEIAIEVSQLEATIAGLREELSKKGVELEGLNEKFVEKDNRVSELEKESSEARKSWEECNEKATSLQDRLDSQRILVNEQLNYISRAHDQICEIVKNADFSKSGQFEFVESRFMWKEMDMDENLRTSLDGTASLCQLSKLAAEKVQEGMDLSREKVEWLSEKLDRMVEEKKHIGTLLRSALSSKTSEVQQVAEDGLREAGIDFKFNSNGQDKQGAENGEVDEVYTLAGALENTVKASQIEIIELQHLVGALRAESSLLKTSLDAQAKEIEQQKLQLKEIEEKERVANENVEGLMIDIAAAEEEIRRWKAAAEQEAAAGESIEQEFTAKMSTLRRELDEAKQEVSESENKIKFKEETAAAAMAAREAAEKSLKLADTRATILRERMEELNRQFEESDGRNDSRNQNGARYVCWPWQWLGLNYVRYETGVQESSNEMELSEPLL